MKPFKKRKKLKEFISEGQTSEVNAKGIKYEYLSDLIIKIFLFGCVIFGLILCIKDIRDANGFVEFVYGVMSFKYMGSLVGGAVIIIAIIGLIIKKPKVNIKK